MSRFQYHWSPAMAALTALGLAAGCANPHGQMVAFLNAHDQVVSTGEYAVMPPDMITIHSPGADEIDGATPRIRPDGKISLRLLGEVHVAGLTTEQIGAKLRGLLSRYYVDPQVVVDIGRYRSHRYYVFGQVKRPGPKPYTGRDTLLAALSQAQPTFLAWKQRIRVVRPSRDKQSTKIITVDLTDMVRNGSTDHDVLLLPGDIIEVPPTPLAWLGLRVRELLYPIEPIVETYTRPADTVRARDTYRDENDS